MKRAMPAGGRAEKVASPRARRKRRAWRIVLASILVLALLLVAARLALPSYLQSYVNRTIDQSPEYDGRVGTIEVTLGIAIREKRDLMAIIETTRKQIVEKNQASGRKTEAG